MSLTHFNGTLGGDSKCVMPILSNTETSGESKETVFGSIFLEQFYTVFHRDIDGTEEWQLGLASKETLHMLAIQCLHNEDGFCIG